VRWPWCRLITARWYRPFAMPPRAVSFRSFKSQRIIEVFRT
jgi:hypothetical protein